MNTADLKVITDAQDNLTPTERMNRAIDEMRAKPSPFQLQREMKAACAKLIERTKEALLEARDETDVRWMRDAAIRNLNGIFAIVSLYSTEFALIKLEALEDLEHEFRIGHFAACQRSRKWRRAVVARYFGE